MGTGSSMMRGFPDCVLHDGLRLIPEPMFHVNDGLISEGVVFESAGKCILTWKKIIYKEGRPI